MGEAATRGTTKEGATTTMEEAASRRGTWAWAEEETTTERTEGEALMGASEEAGEDSKEDREEASEEEGETWVLAGTTNASSAIRRDTCPEIAPTQT